MDVSPETRTWKLLYRMAVSDPKAGDIGDRITAAEGAIIARARQLFRGDLYCTDERNEYCTDERNELDELDETLDLLHALKFVHPKDEVPT